VLKYEPKLIAATQHLLMLVLLIYLAYWLAKLIWFGLSMEPHGPTVMTLPQTSVSEQKLESSKSGQLASFHLFGEAGKVVEKPRDEPIVAPKTSLRLVLKGVFTAKEGGRSGAIIEEMGKSAEYYSIGAVLPGNATLEEVYEDRVLLKRNGRLETLAFDEKNLSGESAITKTEVAKKPQVQPAQQTVVDVKTPEQFIDEATRQISENPEQALQSVGLSPSSDGYVYQGGNPMLSGLNLKKGDVIRSVNGHNLGDIKKDKNLMKSLYEQGSLEVEVVRDGASFYINYPLR
jgi:general secretion pathway protein C